jgi:hypothetical protein
VLEERLVVDKRLFELSTTLRRTRVDVERQTPYERESN